MTYRLDPLSANCYEGTTCLINKFGIRDEKALAKVEEKITSGKLLELECSPLPGVPDFSYYRAIHRFLFADLYDWAGDVRTVNLS